MRHVHGLKRVLTVGLGFLELFAVTYDFILNEVFECCHAFGLAQLFGVGEEHRHFGGLNVRQHADQMRRILCDVVGQNPDAQIMQDPLENAEIVVYRQEGLEIVEH